MFASVFKEVYGLLDKRFTLNAFFPSTILGIGLLAVWEATGEGLDEGIKRFAALDGTTKSLIAILSIASLLVLSTLLASQTPRLLNWLEGKSGPFNLPFLRDPGIAWWTSKQADALTAQPSFTVPREGFEVAPTALGTLGYANSEYTSRNYGMDLAILWPRLAPLVDEKIMTDIDGAESAIEQHVSFLTTAMVFGVVAGAISAYHRTSVLVSLLLPLGGFALGFVLSRSLMPAAVRWSELVRTAVDLSRFDLLDSLQLPRPRTSEEERKMWLRVGGVLLAQETERSLGYLSKEA